MCDPTGPVRRGRRAVLAAGAAGLAATVLPGCSRLSIFNALVPVDGDSRRVAADVAFGPEPRHRLDVYAPAGTVEAAATAGAGPLPVAVFIYGGSWQTGSKDDYAFVGHALASQGYVTVIADYRLVPQVRYPAFVDDGARALEWTRRTVSGYGGDAGRIHLIGHSAGAYNAMMLAADPRFLARRGMAPSQLVAVAGLSGPYDFLPLDSPATRAAFGTADDLPSTQPVNLVSPAMPPVFLATGGRDTTVRARNTRVLAERLQAAGVTSLVRIYPRIGHAGTLLALSRPLRGRAPVLEAMLSFFDTVG